MVFYSCVSEPTWKVPFVGMATVPNEWKIFRINNINNKVRTVLPWCILHGRAQSHRDLFLPYLGCVHLLDHWNRTWLYFMLISGLELRDWWYGATTHSSVSAKCSKEGLKICSLYVLFKNAKLLLCLRPIAAREFFEHHVIIQGFATSNMTNLKW